MLSSNFGKKLQLRIYNIGAAAEGYNVILIKNDCTQKIPHTKPAQKSLQKRTTNKPHLNN